MTLDTSGQAGIQKRVFDVQDARRKLRVIEVETACCAPDVFREWAWYFEIDARMFVAKLFCWQDEAKTDQLRQTLKDVVLHLRVDR